MNDDVNPDLSALHHDIVSSVKNIEALIQPNTNRALLSPAEFDEMLVLLNEINSHLENIIEQSNPPKSIEETFFLDEDEKCLP